jgi:protein O-mannosyl-transferase
MSKQQKTSTTHASVGRPGTFLTAAPLGMLAGLGLIIVVALVAYVPSINGGFIWDDYLLLVDNPLVKAPDGLHQIWCTAEAIDYWPATNTSFWLEWRMWGMNSTGYHVANLVLHVLESLLIWIILRKLSVPGALLAALIFAVHPVNVESVAWIAQRKNTMAMLFFLLSILWYLKAVMPTASEGLEPAVGSPGSRTWAAMPQEVEKNSRNFAITSCDFVSPVQEPVLHSAHCLPSTVHCFPWYWLSLASFLLAMLGKGSVALLPALLLGIIWWLPPASGYPLKRRDLLRIAPFFVIAAILAAVNVEFQTHATDKVVRAISFIDRLLGAGGVVWFYLYKAILPIDLAFVYHQWHINAGAILWWLPLMAVLALTAVLWRFRKSWSRDILFAWGFFCVALVPVMGFTDTAFMQYSLVADRYQHIAIIGLIALASAVWSAWLRIARGAIHTVAIAVAVMAIGALVFLTLRQNALYRDAMTLYQATLAKNPDCVMAQFNYANALSKTIRPQDAIGHYKQAIRLKPDFAMAYYGLGNTLVKTGRAEESIEHFQEFLRLKPGHAEVNNSLGNAFSQLGRTEEAIEQYDKALAINPALPEAHMNLGNILLQQKRPQEAIEHFQQVLQLLPEKSEAYAMLGIALAQTGRLPEAAENFRQALAQNPNDAETHKNLGNALIQTDRPNEAIEQFKQALQIKPDYAGAYYMMAMAYANINRTAEAIDAAQKALNLARAQKQTELARQIEDWLNSYQGRGTSGGGRGKD